MHRLPFLVLGLAFLSPVVADTTPDQESMPLGLEQESSVIIKASVDEVWAYLSDSSNAEDWSIYFDHITPQGDRDGGLGSVRRCYRRADETGPTWDEVVLEVEAPHYRRMRTYDLRGFDFPGHEDLSFVVHQRVEAVGPDQTKLTLGSSIESWGPILRNPKLAWFLVTEFKPEATRIIEDNLVNIAHAVENGPDAPPPRAYEPTHAWDRGNATGSSSSER